MATFSELLKRAWGNVFHDKKSFWHMLLIPLIPLGGLLVLGLCVGIIFAILYFSGFDFSIFTESFVFPLLGGILGLLLLLSLIVVSLVCTYISRRVLANNFLNKKETLRELFSHWRKSGNFFGTYFANFLYTIPWIIGGLLPFLLLIIDDIMIIPAIIIFSLLITYVSIKNSLSMGVFFFENWSWFDALKASRELVHKRWWKTFGFFLLFALVIGLPWIIVSVLFAFLTNAIDIYFGIEGAYGISFIINIALNIVQSVITLLGTSYAFSLYHEYKKHPVVSLKESKIKS